MCIDAHAVWACGQRDMYNTQELYADFSAGAMLCRVIQAALQSERQRYEVDSWAAPRQNCRKM